MTTEIRHLFGDEQDALMQPGSFLVNIARGGLVDEGALRRGVDALFQRTFANIRRGPAGEPPQDRIV